MAKERNIEMRIIRALKQINKIHSALDIKGHFLKSVFKSGKKTPANIAKSKTVKVIGTNYDAPELNRFDSSLHKIVKKAGKKNNLSLNEREQIREMANNELYGNNYKHAYKTRSINNARTSNLGGQSVLKRTLDPSQELAQQVAERNKIEMNDLQSLNKTVRKLKKQGIKI